MINPEEYANYSDAEWAAYRRGQVDALRAWYTEAPFAEAVYAIWEDNCEGYCSACLDSDFPRNVVVADIVRAAHIQAFGAIRRAVAEARRIDRGVFYETDANVIDYREAEAAAVRRAIRAAIGSPKA